MCVRVRVRMCHSSDLSLLASSIAIYDPRRAAVRGPGVQPDDPVDAVARRVVGVDGVVCGLVPHIPPCQHARRRGHVSMTTHASVLHIVCSR